MFDVSWTDPSHETVGERRSRKESRDQNCNDLKKVNSSSQSSTSNGSHPQNRPSFFGLFGTLGPISNVKKGLRRSGSQSKIPSTQVEKNEKAKYRVSSYTMQTSISDPESAINAPALTNFFDIKPFLARGKPDPPEDAQSDTSDAESKYLHESLAECS